MTLNEKLKNGYKLDLFLVEYIDIADVYYCDSIKSCLQKIYGQDLTREIDPGDGLISITQYSLDSICNSDDIIKTGYKNKFDNKKIKEILSGFNI